MAPQAVNESSPRVWVAETWLITIDRDAVCRHQLADERLRQETLRKISSGESLRNLFGKSVQQLDCQRISSVAWIPAAQTLLLRYNWLRDPWRLRLDDLTAGEQLFQAIGHKLPERNEVIQTRTSPQDLEMDPQLGLSVMLVVFAMMAMIGGALEGAGNAPMPLFEWLFRWVGRTAGLVAVGIIGVMVLISGVAALILWFRNRPLKVVIRSHLSRLGWYPVRTRNLVEERDF